MSNVDINVDRRTDRQKIGRLYRTLLQAGAIKIVFMSVVCQTGYVAKLGQYKLGYKLTVNSGYYVQALKVMVSIFP